MSKTVGKYIEENILDIRKLQKLGIVSCTLLTNYSIYSYFKSLSPQKIPSKMDRYEFTAESLKTNTTTVRNAIRAMEKSM